MRLMESFEAIIDYAKTNEELVEAVGVVEHFLDCEFDFINNWDDES